MDDKALRDIARDLRGHLDWLEGVGVRELPAPPRVGGGTESRARGPLTPGPSPGLRPVEGSSGVVRAEGSGVVRAEGSGGARAEGSGGARAEGSGGARAEGSNVVRGLRGSPGGAPVASVVGVSLPAIREELGDCRRCRLCEGRTNIVFGAGNPKAELCFVGEGPGADEDRTGEPFVGAAGQLLGKMIVAMGLTRDDVYICNLVKCRPPGNRNPEPDEIEQCLPFLKGQIRSVRPKALVALGKVATQALLDDKTPISRLRGRWREWEGTPLMPTFHPAYLLRSPGEKPKAWEDLKAVVKALGRELPGK
ncbi:MAG: uracil-DNA glycosylase [Deltaproteobacteria bacterium]